MKRYILTGTPGSGKTTILHRLAALGHATVEEAATAVIAAEQARGEAEPWTRPSFVDQVVAVQRQATLLPGAARRGWQFFDRSPICTHALSIFVGHPISPALSAEIDRITRERVYEREVFFVRNLGFCEPTAARRIGFEESLVFERLHEETYRTFGYRIVDVPAGPVAGRVAVIEAAVGAG
ncbi:AAA family ATPase [Nonomuraea sp. NPDC048882]|uniref:AAA family ATPase n=1 Tax=unclassified Nonomuraea TaxID=2593643 RepID=UPI00340C75FA